MSWDFREFAFSAVAPNGDRIKVRIAPLPVPALEGEAPPGTFSELRWGEKKLASGAVATMTAKVKDVPEGSNLRFIVESFEGGVWVHFAAVPGELAGGTVSGTLQLPQGAAPKLRFRVEPGKAKKI